MQKRNAYALAEELGLRKLLNWLLVAKLVLVVNYFSFCEVSASLLPVTDHNNDAKLLKQMKCLMCLSNIPVSTEIVCIACLAYLFCG